MCIFMYLELFLLKREDELENSEDTIDQSAWMAATNNMHECHCSMAMDMNDNTL